ncbi:hypothetical protein JOF53_000757 [Crossiella equi]|uniref:Uncharacterized protein n=1 Tax=Crossiella equi TaxID=130796 RepID=A0ABS5A5M1_9PSEU|nr:hypothetical protein [Crossiella equi]MBP2471885.1 hypothetical protein [Crossiella equi]
MNAMLLEPRTAGQVDVLAAVPFENEPSMVNGVPSACITTCVSWVTWTCDSTTFCASLASPEW